LGKSTHGKQRVLLPNQFKHPERSNMSVLKAAFFAWQSFCVTALAWSQVATTPSSGNSQDAPYRQILMSTAWCSFTYNKVSGTSTTRRVVFRPDGILTINGGAETYSSGYGGTFAGQSSNANAVRWKYENLRLYLDEGAGGGFQDIGLTATLNSNGSIILHALGREYAMCR
jgi:hypothetical protein